MDVSGDFYRYAHGVEDAVAMALAARIGGGLAPWSDVSLEMKNEWRAQAYVALRAAVDAIGWEGLRAMDRARDGGQWATEDAGGYRARCIGYALGVVPLTTGETPDESTKRLIAGAKT